MESFQFPKRRRGKQEREQERERERERLRKKKTRARTHDYNIAFLHAEMHAEMLAQNHADQFMVSVCLTHPDLSSYVKNMGEDWFEDRNQDFKNGFK